jgi:integrase
MQVGATKTYAARTITLPRSLVRELAAQLVDATADALIFADQNGAHRRYGNFRRDAWDPAVARAGLNITPHDLRATTCASPLVDAGPSSRTSRRISGTLTSPRRRASTPVSDPAVPPTWPNDSTR